MISSVMRMDTIPEDDTLVFSSWEECDILFGSGAIQGA